MSSTHSADEIMRTSFPRSKLSPATRSATEALLADRSALLVTPDTAERELPWRLTTAAGRRPVLIVAPSERDLDRRAGEIAQDLELVTCHIRSNLTDGALDVLTDQLAGGKWHAALVSGRGLSDPRVLRAARALAPRLLVIEDAGRLTLHCERYDPAWQRTRTLTRDGPAVLALCSVAGVEAREDIIDQLGSECFGVFLSGLDAPELRIEIRRVPNQPQKDAHLLGLFLDPPHRAVVYANEHVEAERLAALIRDERGFDALDITNLDAREFGGALRRFREGGLRVLVTTGALDRERDWPEIPVVVSVGLPGSLELLHRQLHTASGDSARFALIREDDEAELPRLERAALSAAPDTGQMLALHAAVATGERLSSDKLSQRTGMHPEKIVVALGALIHAGALRPLARGDDWLKAEVGEPLAGSMLERWSRHWAEMRASRLSAAEQMREFSDSRRCRRGTLAEALDYPLAEGDCRCDRCHREAPVLISGRIPGGYPIKTGGFRGWALALYRRPGEDTPTRGPGRLVERLKYHGEEGCGRRLAWLMHKRVRESRTYRDCDVIVVVPPSDDDLGGSPAALLAREIGRLSDLPVAFALTAIKERAPQKELTSVSAKKRNIAGAFDVVSADLIADGIVLLVDDIYDSGTTMHEAATTLVRAGAKDVRMLTAVRTAFGWRRNT